MKEENHQSRFIEDQIAMLNEPGKAVEERQDEGDLGQLAVLGHEI